MHFRIEPETRVIRQLVLLAALAASPAMAEEAFRDAIVVNAGVSIETLAAGEQAYSVPMNQITVRIDGMIVTAAYATWSTTGKNAAGAFIIGDTMQVKFGGRRGQKLIVQVPGGSTVTADVIRRERE